MEESQTGNSDEKFDKTRIQHNGTFNDSSGMILTIYLHVLCTTAFIGNKIVPYYE